MIPPHIREALTERSRGLCEAGLKGCGVIASDVHHVKFKSRGGSDDLINLRGLCRNCHNACHDHKPGTDHLRTHSWQEEGTTEADDHKMGQD